MARVFCDVGIFGETWFGAVADELLRGDKVRVSYGGSRKLKEEHEKCVNALRFFKLMGDLNKRDDADPAKVEAHQAYLEGLSEWRNEKDCDDPHIFAIAFEKPFEFIFTTDDDLANCRRCMNRLIDKRYCGFRLISREANYLEHKHKVFS